jgi:hypothetical protein
VLQAFEESQGKLEEELATRTAKEIALREEAEARKAAEASKKRYATYSTHNQVLGGFVMAQHWFAIHVYLFCRQASTLKNTER